MMATEPIVSHVTDSASYDGINTVRKKLVVEICKETKPGTGLMHNIYYIHKNQ